MGHGSSRLSIAGAATRIKTVARACADSNQSLTGVPGGSIDGVGSWAAAQVILLTGQTDASENGLWRIRSGAWRRTGDLAAGKSAAGVSTFVSQGSSHGNKSWQCTNDTGDDVVGTDDLVWVAGATAYTHPTTAGNKHVPSGGASGEFLKYTSDGTAVWDDDNDTVYVHPTTAGNKHVPAGGSSNQVLKYTSAGTAVWGTDDDTVYTHPTSAGNKHVPAGGAADQVLTYDSAGTAVWAAASGGGGTPSYLDLIRKNNLPGGKRLAYYWMASAYLTTEPELQGIGWEIGDIIEYASAAGSYAVGADAGGHWAEMKTPATINKLVFISANNKKQALLQSSDPFLHLRFSITDVDDARLFVGLLDKGYTYSSTGSDNVNANSVGFLYSDTLDTNIQFQTRKVSVGQTLVDTGVAPDSSEIYDIELEFSSSGTSLRGRITDYEGNILFSDTSITTNLPAATLELSPALNVKSLAAAAKGFRWYRAEVWV